MASLVIDTPPAVEPVDLVTLKSHLRVTTTADDTLLGVYLQAAREGVENFLGRSLITKLYRQNLDSFPYYIDSLQSQQAYPPNYYSAPRYSTTQWNYSQMIKLLRCPLNKVLKIEITNADGTTGTLSPAQLIEPWEASTEYELGDQTEDNNGNIQEVTALTATETGGASISGATVPTWNATPGLTTTDGDLTWTNKGAAPAADFVYDADSEPPRIFPYPGTYWPPVLYVPNAVRIYFEAGYGADGKNVPALAKVAVMQAVSLWYENREPVTDVMLKEIPGNVQAMLSSLRVLDLAPTRG